MKTNFKRVTSILLCLAMIVGLFPVMASAAPLDNLSGIVQDTNSGNGVELTKKVVYDPATGKVTTEVEAYTTGTVTSSVVTKPTDIILVLDTSGSMAWSFSGSDNGSNERLNSLKNAVNSFIDKTKELNDSATDKHSIAIVTFASNATVAANFTTVDATGAASLKSKIDGLRANGATAVDYGLEEAYELLSNRVSANGGAYEDREKVVIVFTDGDPTHGSSYDDQVAHDAVNEALNIKDMGAKIYTIGIFNGADPAGTDDSNIFMNYASSNYPKAYGSEETEYMFMLPFPVTTYKINAGATPHNTGYYLTASNASALNNVFDAISSHIGKPDISLGKNATLIDVVSDYFVIEGVGTSNPTISAKTAAYKGGGIWETPVEEAGVTTTLVGEDTITVAGFDFDNNYVSETARDGGFYGKKLILTFVTTPVYSAIDNVDFVNSIINTNDIAAILDASGTAVEYVSSPTITANTVTYVTNVNGVVTTVATYDRLPGAEVTLLAKPANTAEYTYSDWTATGVTLGTGATSFTMPQGNVVLTSTATTNSYEVTYEYRGNIPAGTTPAVVTSATEYAVGATVTHPTVIAPEGFVFSGWTEDNNDVAAGATSFTMPAEDVHFVGHFVALPTSYRVEHYLMDPNGGYPNGAYSATPDHTIVYDNFITGDVVKATLPAHTGYTYDLAKTIANNASMSTDATPVPMGTVLADGTLVLKVYFKLNEYQVEYKYDGTVPGDATALPATTTHYYHELVDVADDATASGYDFSGWRVYTGDTAIDTNGQMLMPDHGVVIHGSFTARGDTEYIIEHYFENIEDDGFTLTKITTKKGLTDAIAYAEPLSDEELIGFTFDVDGTYNVVSGVISASSTLRLKLYYLRTRHNVTYEYTGNVPGTASPSAAMLATNLYSKTNVKYGAKVTIGEEGSAPGYTFEGWFITGHDIVVSNNNGALSFTMPARDVHITGHFNPIPSKYVVEHWLETANGSYVESSSTEYSVGVYATQSVTGIPNTYNSYVYDTAVTALYNAAGITVDATGVTGEVTADGNLVLRLYYTRKAYDITYSFENNPASVPVPTPSVDVKHGEVVNLADITTTVPAGYTFDGWYYGNDYVGGSLTMPRNDVALVGKFIADNDVQYSVKYYLQNLDGTTYTEQTGDGYSDIGTTGQYVTAESKTYHGFHFNATKSKWNGHIEGDGSLVLEVYYDRNTFTVSYVYFGTPPTDATLSLNGTPLTLTAPDNLLVTKQENVMYGTPLTVEADIVASDSKYEFRGWYTANIPTVTATTELDSTFTYTMPNHDVEFRGVVYNYTVYYDLAGGTLNGNTTVDAKSVAWVDADLIPGGTPEKPNMIFLGWRYADRASYVTSSDRYCDLAEKAYVENIILVAEYANVYAVEYTWGSNAPSTETLPTTVEGLLAGATHDVDTTYTAGMTVDEFDVDGKLVGTWTFSGWDKSGTITISDNVLITGSWTFESAKYSVEYVWGTQAPASAQLPTKAENIEYGNQHTVDTTFTAGMEIDEYDNGSLVGTWTFLGWNKAGTFDVKEDTVITGTWRFDEAAIYSVGYIWTGDVPYGVVLPDAVDGLYYGDKHVVDTTYSAGTAINDLGTTGNIIGTWVFSGWDKTGTIDVTADIIITGTWTYEKAPLPTGAAKLTKVNAKDNATVIAGVVFDLYHSSGAYYGTYTTDANGVIVVASLVTGEYYWVEKRAAEGYMLDATPRVFVVEEGKTTAIVVENTKTAVPGAFGDDHYAYIIGRSDGLVHPEANITRAEVATIFFRLLGESTRTQYMTTENEFSDVNEGDWFNTAVSTMAAMGIINGRPNGTFDPNAFITRAEFAAIAARFDTHGNSTDASFVDIYDHWAKKEINIAANNGWVLGYVDDTFRPDQYITRAEAMTMVNRVLQRIPEKTSDLIEGMIVWPDNMDTNAWYYLMVQEATNSHYYDRKQSGYEYWTGLREVPDWTAYEK